MSVSHFDNPLPGVPSVESPFFGEIFSRPEVSEETRRVALDLHTKGFAVIDFPDSQFDTRAEAIKTALHDRYDWENWRAKGGRGSLRLQDAWQFDDNVKQIACNERILRLLSELYGASAFPFQTLNFPVGTQQHFHSDSLHFSSSPERFMCGVWVALEDVTEDTGPLVYYPGSHKWPIYTNEHIGHCAAKVPKTPSQSLYEPMWRALIETHDVKPEYFCAKKGQALIWAANLLHGGAPQHDRSRTRWSQVTHYFFENCAYYTPMMSDTFFGRIAFRNIQDIRTGEVVPNRYAGNAIDPQFVRATSPDYDWWEYCGNPPPKPPPPGPAMRLARKLKRMILGPA